MITNIDGKYIITPFLDRVQSVRHLNNRILFGIKQGFEDMRIVLIENQRTYPNVCVPIAGIVDFYRGKGIGIEFEHRTSADDYIKHTRIDNPIDVEQYEGTVDLVYPLDKIWCYETSEGVSRLVSAFIEAIRQTDELGSGVLKGIEWCINETLDNVLQHSQAKKGFVMCQLQKTSQHMSFCVFDTGIGIYGSLKDSKHHPASPLDAITIALQENMTRDPSVGQGNGMWGLSRIVSENDGRLRVSSCGAVYDKQGIIPMTAKTGDFNLGKDNGTTLVDFQLDYSKNIDVKKALNTPHVIDLWIENIEDEEGAFVIDVAKNSSGTGTRQSAQRLRNVVINTLKETQGRLILDFSSVSLISSSFSDELIGKLIVELGFVNYSKAIALKNISDENVYIINRSVGQRMAQLFMSYQDPHPEEQEMDN